MLDHLDPRALMAASNNADLYAAVFGAHRVSYRRTPFCFVAEDQPPPYYACLTTTSVEDAEGQDSEIAVARQRFGKSFGFKDSFCRYDMSETGMRLLFTASWILRPPVPYEPKQLPQGWAKVDQVDELVAWEDAWQASGSPASQRVFPIPLLGREDFFFLGCKAEGRWLAGCIANLSHGSVGLSNVFSRDPDYPVHRFAVEALTALVPELPIVGYDSGADLQSMLSLGFSPVGDLRVWVEEES
ncbi:hypothetical protein ABID21_002598 [Pseudorhizobium tarimense]|uniref:N-acetyltransferase domain-containing protein n=1 Tax=Pseudorhizobium tarimense TaxID=1079109 RepID=A0ABV2H7H0_9HYPH|nr:hypothetical protein [Pseudorhizobium tarimense]MCJ8519677.1 hypothetical protein [Pseudorhizobium tarimense]